MRLSKPDQDWFAYSTGYGPWSVEAEEGFQRRLKILHQYKLASSKPARLQIEPPFNIKT